MELTLENFFFKFDEMNHDNTAEIKFGFHGSVHHVAVYSESGLEDEFAARVLLQSDAKTVAEEWMEAREAETLPDYDLQELTWSDSEVSGGKYRIAKIPASWNIEKLRLQGLNPVRMHGSWHLSRYIPKPNFDPIAYRSRSE